MCVEHITKHVHS